MRTKYEHLRLSEKSQIVDSFMGCVGEILSGFKMKIDEYQSDY